MWSHIRSLKRIAPLMLALAAPLAFAQAEAGKVLLVIGKAYVGEGAQRQPLTTGAQLNAGDRIVTLDGAHVHVRMADGGLLALRPHSMLDIEVFDYQPTAPEAGRVRYRLHEGVSRSVTGHIGQANKDAFRLNTSVAAIGVRGTDFITSANAQQTRASVNSGAIVVSALDQQGCQANSFGACSTGLHLQAGLATTYAEVDATDRQPRLRQDAFNHPGRNNPAHPEEPTASSTEKNDLLATERKPEGNIVQAPPAPVHWGRWKADLPGIGGSTVAQLRASEKSIQLVNAIYGLGVSQIAERVPQTGQIAFALAGGEAFLQRSNGQLSPADLASGRLGVDFDQRQFQVSLNIEAEQQAHLLQAAGAVDVRGYLIANAARSNAIISTVLNADLQNAGSLFNQALPGGSAIIGVAAWKR